MTKPETQNCIDIIQPYIDAVTAEDMPPVQLLGGVGSVALINPKTIIDPNAKRIIAPADITLSNYRDDGNLRDVETLVPSTRQVDIDVVQQCAEATIGNRLIIETFAFRDKAAVDAMRAKPLGKKALFMFVSDRYISANTTWAAEGETAERVIFPFCTPIPSEALETWTLEIGDNLEIPVPAPGAIILNYLTRSISGFRSKDRKLHAIARTIVDKDPDTLDWIIDGPGRTQFSLARVLHTLREPKDNPRVLLIGDDLIIDPLLGELNEHPAFMFQDAEPRLQSKILNVAKLKSRGLHYAESIDPVVTTFQRYVEPRISGILHNS